MSNVRRFMHLKKRFACTGKRKYRTEKEARKVAVSLSKAQGTVVLEYRCPYCGTWHLGHTPSRVTMPAPEVAS